ncbi:MAG: hypothetical protein LUF78_05700 [Clostridiales bacterium]|nr:hypothetical protein [Clostridiales bacterium]
MAVLQGCESKFRTAEPVDRVCPKCGQEVEVFELNGRVVEDAACECGYVFEAEEKDSPKVERKKD